MEDSKKQDEEIGLNEFSQKRNFFGRTFLRSQNGEGQNVKHGMLFFLEKFTRKLRVFFLKLENLFTHWSESLKRKRKNQIESEELQAPSGEAYGQDEIIERVKNHELGKAYSGRNVEIKTDSMSRQTEEKIIKPMVSEKVVVPQSKPEIKNRLERILIERIAANPKDTEAYERLGEYYFEIENYQHSKECFKQVIKLDPMNINVKDKMRRLERLLTRR